MAKPCLRRLARVTCYASAGHPDHSWPSVARAWVWWGEEAPRLPSPCNMWGDFKKYMWYHGIGTGTFFVSGQPTFPRVWVPSSRPVSSLGEEDVSLDVAEDHDVEVLECALERVETSG